MLLMRQGTGMTAWWWQMKEALPHIMHVVRKWRIQ
jgi:hypothetical protein